MTRDGSLAVLIQGEEIVRYQHAVSGLIRKLDRRLIPFLALLEIARFGFQVAIGVILAHVGRTAKKRFRIFTGHAMLTTFKSDLNLTVQEYNWSTSAFFLAYVSRRGTLPLEILEVKYVSISSANSSITYSFAEFEILEFTDQVKLRFLSQAQVPHLFLFG
jgi:hypothetical protein